MRKLVVAAVLTALALPGSALAGDRHVKMQSNRFTPSSLPALPGDKVTWTHLEASSTTKHNVSSAQFRSVDLLRGDTFEWVATPGTHAYECTYHRATMRGKVVVADVHLTGPAATLTHGAAARFTGLTQPNSSVTIHAPDGTAAAPVQAGADGSFTALVPMARPGLYRAEVAGVGSAVARIKVKPRVGITSRRSGARLLVTVATNPAQAGAPVVLERRSGSRWAKLAVGRLNASSKATFRVARKAMKIRARTTRGVGGYTAATSRVVGVR